MSNASADTAQNTARLPAFTPLAGHVIAAELDQLADRLHTVAAQVGSMPGVPGDARAWIVLQLTLGAQRASRAADGIDGGGVRPAPLAELDLEPFALVAPGGSLLS